MQCEGIFSGPEHSQVATESICQEICLTTLSIVLAISAGILLFELHSSLINYVALLHLILQQDSLRSQRKASPLAKELDPVQIARDVLGIVIKFKGFPAVITLEDDTRPSHRPDLLIIHPTDIDDTVPTCIDLTWFEEFLDIDLVQIRIGARTQ